MSRFPIHGWLGVALVFVAWPLNWALDGLRTHIGFFPLWLGYALAVDGLCVARRGTSLALRSPRGFALLFVISAPVWWLFEAANVRLQNWEYLGREHFSNLEYALLASLSFTTVLPSVLATAELARGSRWIERCRRGPIVELTPRLRLAVRIVGVGGLAAMLLWPRYFFPFVWVAPALLLEDLNAALGRRTLTTALGRGDWREWIALWSAGLVCGFFWELWNLHSYPKWIYHVPFVDFARLFEMPILGYLGYLPFALSLFLCAHLLLPRAAWLDASAEPPPEPC